MNFEIGVAANQFQSATINQRRVKTVRVKKIGRSNPETRIHLVFRTTRSSEDGGQFHNQFVRTQGQSDKVPKNALEIGCDIVGV